MNNKGLWEILNWNTRGINSDKKWTALANKIEECNCEIICLQETKREQFDAQYLKNFCPKRFNKFAFLPSVGASGGMINIWNGSLFNENFFLKMTFLYLCNSAAIYQRPLVFSQISMIHVMLKEN
jgi:hypothetical protein